MNYSLWTTKSNMYVGFPGGRPQSDFKTWLWDIRQGHPQDRFTFGVLRVWSMGVTPPFYRSRSERICNNCK